jgi:hypothetical protein
VLAEEREWIALQDNIAEAVADLVFVMSAFTNPWDEYFPDPCFDALSHLMGTAIPAVKIANHTDPLSCQRPKSRRHLCRHALTFRILCLTRTSELFLMAKRG